MPDLTTIKIRRQKAKEGEKKFPDAGGTPDEFIRKFIYLFEDFTKIIEQVKTKLEQPNSPRSPEKPSQIPNSTDDKNHRISKLEEEKTFLEKQKHELEQKLANSESSPTEKELTKVLLTDNHRSLEENEKKRKKLVDEKEKGNNPTSAKNNSDQPQAIKKLVAGIQCGQQEQVLLGATGTGKTFTMANVIQQVQKPTLILAHNKTLAMQIYQEMQGFFPHNKVEYYVSYFDYYRPEAYIPSATMKEGKWSLGDEPGYISKKVQRNNNIAKMRLKTLNALVTNQDVIVVASVAAIYGCFNPVSYRKVVIHLEKGQEIEPGKLERKLLCLGYKRNKKINSGTYDINDDNIFFMLGWEENYYFQISLSKNKIHKIEKKNKQTGQKIRELREIAIPPSQDYVGEEGEELAETLIKIRKELAGAKKNFEQEGKFLEAERLEKRVQEDLFNLQEMGFCPGIENYSRYFDGRKTGETPFVLLDYFPEGFLTFIDESHITVPQVTAMYNTDRKRKETLVKHGFRLPSALDNRPLNQEEFFQKNDYLIYVSATPREFELTKVGFQPIEQIIRPTGLLDPQIEVRNCRNQIANIMEEIKERSAKGEKVLVYALTIIMSEDIARYLQEKDIRVVYLHSRLEVFERYQAITSLRRGIYDVIVGINLLKEGIDLPEVSLVCILDADKPGFLRDARSLIQIIGRASRNSNGKVILYANEITSNMLEAMEETKRRRQIQEEYNLQKNITPQTVQKPVKDIVLDLEISILVEKAQTGAMTEKELTKLIKSLGGSMKRTARAFAFDQASAFRNALVDLRKGETNNHILSLIDKFIAPKKNDKKLENEHEKIDLGI
ncbi:8006_t:CDS:2 [Entrophospora sp. SA101]|nr:8006_t:CDS:2 [Entrophospora sp. SA101]